VSYVVVIREQGTSPTPLAAVHQGANLAELLERLARRYTPRRTARWYGKRTDTFIAAHYKQDMSAKQIADELSRRRKRPINKNMVIARARTLGLGGRAVTTSLRDGRAGRQRPSTATPVT
jgi:hypothetical protein